MILFKATDISYLLFLILNDVKLSFLAYFSFILNNPLILSSVGEYSGGPNEQQTYAYAKTVLDLMCKHPHEDGKILIIGGGIANFTNVADTFKVRWKN